MGMPKFDRVHPIVDTEGVAGPAGPAGPPGPVGPPGAGTDLTTQLAWWIDPIDGNDANNGQTQLTAIKTLTHWYNVSCSNGFYSFQTPGVVVHILHSLNAGDTPAGTVNVGAVGTLLFLGSPTTVYTSTGVGVTTTAAVPAANTSWTLTDPSIPDWAPYVAAQTFSIYRVRVTSGANPGAIVWPASRTSAHVAVVSSPMTPDPTLGTYGQSVVTLANGDHFVVESLPILFDVNLYFAVTGNQFNSQEPVVFQNFAFNSATYANIRSNSEVGGEIGFYGCSFTQCLMTGGDFINCRFTSALIQRGSAFFCGMSAGSSSSAMSVDVGFTVFDQQFMLQDAAIAAEQGGEAMVSSLQAQGASNLDCDEAGIVAIQAFLGTTQIWGHCTTSAMFFRIAPLGRVTYDTLVGITAVGTGGASQVIGLNYPGTNTVFLSYAQLPYADAGTLACFEDTTQGVDSGTVAVHTMFQVGGYLAPIIGEINTPHPLPRYNFGGNGVVLATMAADTVTPIPLIMLNASNDAVAGSSANRDFFFAGSRSIIFYSYGYGALIQAGPPGAIGLFNPFGGGVDTGNGTEVLQFFNATTAITTLPSLGPLVQGKGGALRAMSTGGALTTFAPVGDNASLARNEWLQIRGSTVNAATATFAFSALFTLAAQTAAGVEVIAEGFDTAAASSTFLGRRASVRRGAAGGLVVSGSSTQTTDGDAALSAVVMTIVANVNGFDVTILGVAAQTIAWKVSVRILENVG